MQSKDLPLLYLKASAFGHFYSKKLLARKTTQTKYELLHGNDLNRDCNRSPQLSSRVICSTPCMATRRSHSAKAVFPSRVHSRASESNRVLISIMGRSHSPPLIQLLWTSIWEQSWNKNQMCFFLCFQWKHIYIYNFTWFQLQSVK